MRKDLVDDDFCAAGFDAPSFMIDLLQEGTKIGKPFAPEDTVVAHPIEEGGKTLRFGAIEHLPAIGPLGDQTGLLQGLEMLRDSALRHTAPARQFDHRYLIGADHPFEHGSPGWVGEGAHHGIDVGLVHEENISKR
jgi:hypothetical protein